MRTPKSLRKAVSVLQARLRLTQAADALLVVVSAMLPISMTVTLSKLSLGHGDNS